MDLQVNADISSHFTQEQTICGLYNIYNVAGETNPRGLHRFLTEGTSTLVDANVADTFSVSKSIQIKLCFVKWE